jgi:nucleotide-binding universal stress UspA family protein
MRALLATDGSPSAALALELVTRMRWPIGSSIRIVSVVDSAGDVLGGRWSAHADGQAGDIETGLIIETMRHLEDAAGQLRALGLRVDHALLRGRPADELVTNISSHRPDVVVVGNRGHSAFDRMLLGSVSSELVDRSPVPVLVARRPSIDRVLIAVDGSAIAAEAIDAIRYWPFLAEAQICVLSVAPSGIWVGLTPHPEDEAAGVAHDARLHVLQRHAEYAEMGADRLRSIGLDARPEVRFGSAAHAIVSFAEEWHADLVITGSHGRTGLARLVLGSVARNVLHHATCSVLIVKRHAEVVTTWEPSFAGPAWTTGTAR